MWCVQIHPYRWLSLLAILRVGEKAAEDWDCFGNQCGRPQGTKLPSVGAIGARGKRAVVKSTKL